MKVKKKEKMRNIANTLLKIIEAYFLRVIQISRHVPCTCIFFK